MKKFSRILLPVLGLCILATPVLAAVQTVTKEVTYRDIKIKLDGNEIVPKDENGTVVEPFIVDDSTYLPVRGISDALGLGVSWDDSTSTVLLSSEKVAVDESKYVDHPDRTSVIKSADSPTGYYVTFRYKDPAATRVRIKGDWVFTDIQHATYVTSENKGPESWEDGDTRWSTISPIDEMEYDAESGMWTYTIPLPTGTYTYNFLIGGEEGADVNDTRGTTPAADPANINYVAPDETDPLSHVRTSIYVPWDAQKQALTMQRQEEAPRDDQKGTVVYETGETDFGTQTTYVMYLPYGFNVNRAEKYPILVMFHGGGGYEGDWLTSGLGNILDNMIAEGRMEPTIVVMPDCTDFCWETEPEYTLYRWKRESICQFVINEILPTVVEKYNGAEDTAHRAVGGLSQGGATTGFMLFEHPDVFDTYFLLSPPYSGDFTFDFTMPELKEKNIFIGYGDYDFVQHRSLYKLYPNENGELVKLASPKAEGSMWEYVYGLAGEDVPFLTLNYPFGHQNVLWTKLAVYAFDKILWK